MSKNKDVAKAYKRKQIESASPVELIILLYDGAIDFLNRAENLYEPGNAECIEPFHKYLLACQNIITELTVALDMENGGEVAQKLFQLYEYINYSLVDINVTKRIEGIEEIRSLLQTLREGWVKLAENENQEKASELAAKPDKKKNSGEGLNIQG